MDSHSIEEDKAVINEVLRNIETLQSKIENYVKYDFRFLSVFVTSDRIYFTKRGRTNFEIGFPDALSYVYTDNHYMFYSGEQHKRIEIVDEHGAKELFEKLAKEKGIPKGRLYSYLHSYQVGTERLFHFLVADFGTDLVGNRVVVSACKYVFGRLKKRINLSWINLDYDRIEQIVDEAFYRAMHQEMEGFSCCGFHGKHDSKREYYEYLAFVKSPEFECACNSIKILNEIAATYYESEVASGLIQIVKDIKPSSLAVKFKNPIDVENSKGIRKLLVVSDSAIIIVCNGKAVGLSTELIGGKSRAHTIRMLGHMKWGLYYGDKEQFRCVNFRLVVNGSSFQGINISAILNKWFDDSDKRYDQLIKKQLTFRKGAVLIISNEAAAEARRLCSIHRGIEVVPFSVFDCPTAVIGLASIDGAIILDEKGFCYAFGIILDGEAVITGNPTRGARYNSTKNYIAGKGIKIDHKTYVGIVISEDGMIDVFTKDTIGN